MEKDKLVARSKLALKISWKILRPILKFSLMALAIIFSSRTESSEPTLEEEMYGQKLPFSDGYFVPNGKNRK